MLPPPNDVTARLAAVLRPADLDRRPAEFRRLVEHRLQGIGRPVQVADQCLVEGEEGMRVLRVWRTPAKGGAAAITFLMWRDKSRVFAQSLYVGNDFAQGWEPVAWRKRGDRIVGLNLNWPGNWSQPCVVVLRAKPGRWEQRSLRLSATEGSRISFRERESWDVVVHRRSYDFRVMTAPHAGPLLAETTVWTLRGDHYRASRPFVRSRNALDAFDRLVERVESGDKPYLQRMVPDSVVRRRLIAEVKATRENRTVTCPGSYQLESGRVFGMYAFKEGGRDPEWFFELALRQERWQVVRAARENAFPVPSDLP